MQQTRDQDLIRQSLRERALLDRLQVLTREPDVQPPVLAERKRLWAASEPDILRRPQAYSRYREVGIPPASGARSTTSDDVGSTCRQSEPSSRRATLQPPLAYYVTEFDRLFVSRTGIRRYLEVLNEIVGYSSSRSRGVDPRRAAPDVGNGRISERSAQHGFREPRREHLDRSVDARIQGHADGVLRRRQDWCDCRVLWAR